MKQHAFDLWRKMLEISAPLAPPEDQKSKSKQHENRLKSDFQKKMKNLKRNFMIIYLE